MNAGMAKLLLQCTFILAMDSAFGPIGLIMAILIVCVPIVIKGDK